MPKTQQVRVSPAEYELLLMARTDDRTGEQIYNYARRLRDYEEGLDRDAALFTHPGRVRP